MKKILIIQTAYIGDVILATSLLESLHHQYPSAIIDILVRKGAEGLFKNHPFIGEVMVFDKSQKKLLRLFNLLLQIRKNKYDLLINCHRYASSGFLAAFSGSKKISGFKKNPFSFLFHFKYAHNIGDGEHEIERNHKLISFLGNIELLRPKLYPEKIKEDVQVPYVCIAPASVWFTKQWPDYKWVELIDRIPSNTRIYLIGSNNDFNLCETIRSKAGNKRVINFSGKLNLLESASLMQGAIMNYVNDSAPLHLCSSVNAPVTAFFCSTIPGFGFGPLSDSSRIIEIPEKLYCRPCGLHGYKSCPEGHFRCARDISIEQVI